MNHRQRLSRLEAALRPRAPALPPEPTPAELAAEFARWQAGEDMPGAPDRGAWDAFLRRAGLGAPSPAPGDAAEDPDPCGPPPEAAGPGGPPG